MLDSTHGHFDPTGKKYVITDPGTPMPWVNVICNGHYGVVISQNGGGFSWYDNSQLNVLTRWEMDLARDQHGKFLYVSDLEAGEVWSLAPSPCRTTFDRYSCTHTTGATVFETERRGLHAEWTITVAPDAPVEVWRVKLRNTGVRARRLRVSSFFEWCCGVAPDTKREFHRLFFTTSHDAARRAIIVRKNMWDLPGRGEREHWNADWPYVAGHAVSCDAFTKDFALGDKRLMLGRYGSTEAPAAMLSPEPPGPDAPNAFGRFGDASAALGGELTLAPGQTVTLVYTTAIAEDEASLLKHLDAHTNPAAADEAIRASAQSWDATLGHSRVRSSMPDFDLLNSTWLAYQAISGRLWGRTGYYQQSGAFGFRDQLQDSQVWLPREPKKTREQILLHAAHQFADGSVYHWWHPLAEWGLRTACSDDYLWLPFLTAVYIKDTGDWGILDEVAPFVDAKAGATLLEHCQRSIARSLARQSTRGLPLIGSCDWNDGLSSMGLEGKGESVWLAQWLCVVLEDFATVLEHGSTGAGKAPNAGLAGEYRRHRERLIESINTHGWDEETGGAWFRAATRDDGRWIGSAENTEGRVFLNTQTWAVLSGTASEARLESAWGAVKEHLLAPMGPLLSYPAYTEPDPTIGYITRYAPGLRENGGVYMHAATWALAAAAKRGDVASVEQIWRAISPPLRGAEAGAYVAEPYVTPGNVDGPASSTPGRAGWTWYTGSAAWLNRVSLEWIIGMRPVWEGLLIDPCPFAALGKVEATRLWRGRTVRVRFDAGGFVPRPGSGPGSYANVSVGGRELKGGILRESDLAPGTGEIVVDVRWGSAPEQTAASGQTVVVHSNGMNGTANHAGARAIRSDTPR